MSLSWGVNLHLDRDALQAASKDMRARCDELSELRNNLQQSFAQLKTDWDSQAGKIFFDRFEADLLKNLNDYSIVFEHMSVNLNTASQKYEEVFSAADTVANGQF